MLYDPKWEKQTDSPVKTALIAARKLLENSEAWGGPPHATGNNCVYTTISGCEGRKTDAAQKAFCAANNISYARGCVSIWNWNDKPERTHAEVLAAFDRAIAAAP